MSGSRKLQTFNIPPPKKTCTLSKIILNLQQFNIMAEGCSKQLSDYFTLFTARNLGRTSTSTFGTRIDKTN